MLASPTPRPQPENFKTGAEYRWAHKLWKRKHGGSLVVNLAVAALAGGITGSPLAVLAFMALTAAVTVARRRG